MHVCVCAHVCTLIKLLCVDKYVAGVKITMNNITTMKVLDNTNNYKEEEEEEEEEEVEGK